MGTYKINLTPYLTYSSLQNRNSWCEHEQGCNRCSDFDEECVDVEDKVVCYLGGKAEIGVADGYCPFVIGMMRDNLGE